MPPRLTPQPRALAHEVKRSRLLDVLTGSTAPVTVVSAPAGAGKSTLAQQWLACDGRAQATLRLAAHMDDPAALAGQVLGCLEALGPPAPQTRARVTGKEPAFSATLLPALARLAGSRAEPFVLVIDDAHVVRSPAAQQVLESVCEGTPSGSTVVLVTRDLTPDWLARFRASGRLMVVSAEQLRLDADEVTALLSGMGLRVDAQQVAAIVEHTEGWAVGVYLTALSLRSDAESGADQVRLAKGSDRIVSDYLRTQVLAPLCDDDRLWLTRTSILDELDGPRCDAVLERTDSAAVLARLHERIQLVTTVDRDESRYRCHHLLAEELSADLRRLEPGRIAGLHTRASAWFDARGDDEEAVRHAIASGDVTQASRVIWPKVAGCAASTQLGTLRSWLSGLSQKQLASDPWLSMAAAWASLQHGDAPAMGRWSRIAERHAGTGWREAASRDPYAATLAVLHGLVGTGGPAATRDLCERALQGLPPDDQFRASAAINRGFAMTLLGDLDGGRAALSEAEQVARSLDVPVVEVNARSWLGRLAIGEGEREAGIALISSTADLIRWHHLDRLATGAMCMTTQALVLALRGDKSSAVTMLATARRLTSLAGQIAPWFAVSGRLVQAVTAVLLGDGATARQLIAEARALMTPGLAATTLAHSLAEAEETLAQMVAQGGSVSALTTAELRIVQFLPSHLTLAQIGEHLFVSQSTVKTHVLSIYRKLAVSSRAEAVERARALGLVEAPLSD